MSRWDHHPPCPNGCGELADECACPNPNPLGSMTIEPPIGSAIVTDWRVACSTCGRFVKDYGSAYAPWGDSLQFDGFVDLASCPKCGIGPAREVPVRWIGAESDG